MPPQPTPQSRRSVPRPVRALEGQATGQACGTRPQSSARREAVHLRQKTPQPRATRVRSAPFCPLRAPLPRAVRASAPGCPSSSSSAAAATPSHPPPSQLCVNGTAAVAPEDRGRTGNAAAHRRARAKAPRADPAAPSLCPPAAPSPPAAAAVGLSPPSRPPRPPDQPSGCLCLGDGEVSPPG